jgi:mannose-6-phosphate isomerase
MYPIRFEPIYQPYIWGGDRIAKRFKRNISLPKVAESWEISDRDDAMSIVMNGAFKGKTLHQLVQEMGEDLMGVGQKYERFPILTKIIDAKENLSIQVHPDETIAPKLNGEPKDEMWVLLDEGSVYAGAKPDVDEKQLKKAIQENRAEELLDHLELKKGDVVNIPGGRIHAICAGSLLYEVQQNSNTTYRLYDWGRNRELHLKEGFASIRWDDKSPSKVLPHHLSSDFHHQLLTLVISPFFIAERIDIFSELHIAAIPKTFQLFFCMDGEAELKVDGHTELFLPGMTYLVPAAAKAIDIQGRCQAIRVRLP